MSTIFDSHCHPQFPQYDKDREEMLARARRAGVSMICVGTDLETSRKAIELAQQHSNPPSPDGFGGASIWASVGLHPNDIFHEPIIIDAYASIIIRQKVVAVGEIGLDYYRTPEPDKQNKQKEVFGQFLELAVQHKKPVIIHSRDASKGSVGKVHSDTIEIINSKFLIYDSNLGGVAHSFTGTIEEAKKYLNLGFYLGFNGIITFARQYDEIVRYAPLDRILLETDAPYLTPEPYRGQRNEPAYVVEVAKKLAELKNESYEKIIEQTARNTREVFSLELS